MTDVCTRKEPGLQNMMMNKLHEEKVGVRSMQGMCIGMVFKRQVSTNELHAGMFTP